VRFEAHQIGGKILSGRTKDQNIGYIAEYPTAIGIDLKEVRVVGDQERAIVDAVNALRHRCTYCLHHRRDRADPR
jgi:molybdopterin-biosynthesis enzyme MoeA-like protein